MVAFKFITINKLLVLIIHWALLGKHSVNLPLSSHVKDGNLHSPVAGSQAILRDEYNFVLIYKYLSIFHVTPIFLVMTD